MTQIYDMGPTASFPLRRKACWGFFRPKNPTASAGFEPTNLGIKGQHARSKKTAPTSWRLVHRANTVQCKHCVGSLPSPLCVCENWKGYVVKHNYVNSDVLMTILDNYMFRPLLAIFRLSSRELKALIYIMCARDREISTSGFYSIPPHST